MMFLRSWLTPVIAGALACTMAIPTFAQKKGAKKPQPAPSLETAVLATVGQEPIRYGELERAYQRNPNRRFTKLTELPKDSLMDFLKLYSNYRLKVLDAKRRGFDKEESVKTEMANNRTMLAEKAFFDKRIVDARVDDLARRRQLEIDLGVILCAVEDAETKTVDSARSHRKALALIDLLAKGASFEQLARDSSDDRETAARGGRLPWISGGTIIKTVEDEAYRLKQGEFSRTPVGSRFGYFVVKVYRSTPRLEVKARHILLTSNGERDSLTNERFADTVLALLAMPPSKAQDELKRRGIESTGDVFSDVARSYSDDKSSGARGGYLGAYTRSNGLDNTGNRFAPEFEEGVFALKDGQTSGKVRSRFGIHIIRRDSTRSIDPIAERDNAKRTYRRLYFEEDKRILLDSLKKVYGYGWNEAVLAKFRTAIDTTKNINDTTWYSKVPAELQSATIYRMPGAGMTVSAFSDSLRKRLDLKGFTLNTAGFERAINRMVDADIIKRATANLEQNDPEFKSLMDEFNDGIILFKAEDQEVWSKLKFDTTEARAYYEETKARWKTDVRYGITEIYVTSDSLAKALRARIDRGESIGDLAAQFTERATMRDKRGDLGLVEAKRNKLAQRAADERLAVGAVVGPVVHERGWAIFALTKIDAPRQKTFEEALPELAPSFQDMQQKRLQERWLDSVRKTFPVVINDNVIATLYSK